jgi:hypothetical protein
MPMTVVSGNSRFLRTEFHTGAHRRRRVAKEGLDLYGEVNTLDHQLKCFHKHVLSFEALRLLILAIFKLKCNNLIFNEIMNLNASYVSLLHSCFVENHPIWILEDRPLISGVVLSHLHCYIGSLASGHGHSSNEQMMTLAYYYYDPQ